LFLNNGKEIKKMENRMKSVIQKLILFAGTLALALAHMPLADAGTRETGNGGGAWVCYNPSGTIRWAQSVDLYEAEHTSIERLSIERTNLIPVNKQVALATAKILEADRETFEAVTAKIKENGALLVPTSMKLYVIDDANLHGEPDPDDCKGGKIEYGQVANYTEDGKILLATKLYDAMGRNSLTDQAALILHEAIYALLRERYTVNDSVKARKIVGYLFSSADPKSYADEVKLQSNSMPEVLSLWKSYLQKYGPYFTTHVGCDLSVTSVNVTEGTISVRFLTHESQLDSEHGIFIDLCGTRSRERQLTYYCKPGIYYPHYGLHFGTEPHPVMTAQKQYADPVLSCVARGTTVKGTPYFDYLTTNTKHFYLTTHAKKGNLMWTRNIDTQLIYDQESGLWRQENDARSRAERFSLEDFQRNDPRWFEKKTYYDYHSTFDHWDRFGGK